MIPIKSNLTKESCSPVSSNCVIWQGPNLPCIGLCTGDSVSDVIYRVAEELCDIKDSFGFTDVDLTCLLTMCSTVPEPQKTLSNILNLIINKLCCLNDIVALINTTPPPEINVTLAKCFNVTNAQGVPLTVLPHSQYTYLIGVKLCEIYDIVNTHTTQITTLQGQVATLIGTPPPTIPQVTPDCILVPGVPTNIDVVVNELERQFCLLTAATGPNTEITRVLSRQCANLNSQNGLSTGLPLVSTPGWVTTPLHLAHSLQNLWLVACDLRAAVKLIQDNCCKITCSDITVNFEVAYFYSKDSNGRPVVTLTLYFGVDGVNIPSTFYDCDQTNGNKLTISDQSGHSLPRYIKINDPIGQMGILNGTPQEIADGTDLQFINPPFVYGEDLTITADICLTDGTTTCIKCLNITVPFVPSDDCCVITATGRVTIVYKICS